jgi:hypothetical protein
VSKNFTLRKGEDDPYSVQTVRGATISTCFPVSGMFTAYDCMYASDLHVRSYAAIQECARNEKEQQLEEMMGTITRSLLASVLFLLIMLGWLGDSFLSMLIGRPKLSFQEVYRSWKHHLLRQ